MGRFNGDRNDRDTRGDRGGRDSRGGGRSFGGGSSFGRGRSDSGPREMFKTVCSNCGKDCEVPFRPTTGKPVYCSDCFEKMGGRNSDAGRPERNDRSERPRFEHSARPEASRADNSKALNDLNAKLDKIIALLTPKSEKVTSTPILDEVVAPDMGEALKVKPVKPPKVIKAKKVKAVKEAVTA